VGLQVEEDHRAVLPGIAGAVDGGAEQQWLLWIKWDKLATVPVGFELDRKLVEDMAQILGGDLEIPFQPTGHGGMGHVGRTDIGGGKSAVAPKMVGLGVQSGPLGVVGDADLDVRHPGQPLHGGGIGGPHIGRGEQAHRDTTVAQILKRGQ